MAISFNTNSSCDIASLLAENPTVKSFFEKPREVSIHESNFFTWTSCKTVIEDGIIQHKTKDILWGLVQGL